MIEHDSFKQLNLIRQCLADNQKPLAFFISAGCPKSVVVKGSSLIPDVKGLTEIVCKMLTENSSTYEPSIKKILEQLNEDGNAIPTIEDILSYIRALTQVTNKAVVREFDRKSLEELDKVICEKIEQIVNVKLPEERNSFHKFASWIKHAERNRAIEIFTTNYDLIIEQSLEYLDIPYFDGFAGSYRPFFDLSTIEENGLPKRWAKVWKIHGSVNWFEDDKRKICRTTNSENNLKHIIHPSYMKYDQSKRLPYLAMMDRLKSFIKLPSSALFILGYSFNDEHINENFRQSLESNQTSIVFALLFGNLNKYPKALELANKRRNLNLIAENGAVIGSRKGGWIKKESTDYYPAGAIEVKKELNKASKTEEIKEVIFKLGDFTIMGDFLEDVVGETIENGD